MEWKRVRSMQSDDVARPVRVVLGTLFVMTGAMKLVVPMLAAAWAGQLAAANIPLAKRNRWMVLSLYILVKGGGSGSLDLKATNG